MNRPFNDAQQVAEGVLAAKGRTFHWARRLLGKKHAARATRLYALCRYLDDLADEATSLSAAQASLATARHTIETGQTTNPRLLDGLHLLQECAIDPTILLELIRGITSDLGQVRVADEAELVRYCYRVAGTVGLMMCRVLDVTEEAAMAHAVDLGIAMQLTNICRDVAEDAVAGRRYLPASLVGELDPAELIFPAESLQPQLRRSLETLLLRADCFYQSGELGLPYLPLQARCSILIAARVYRAIGSRLRRQNDSYWTERAVVSDWEKAYISLQALTVVPLGGAFWHCRNSHRTELHRHLAGLPGLGGHFEK